MAHCSSDGHVGCIFWPQTVGSRKNPDMPTQCLMRPEVAYSQRIHLWEGKSASNQPRENSNASPDCCDLELQWHYEGRPMLWSRQLSKNTSVRPSPVQSETREGQVYVGADVPSVREAAGCFLWVLQQSKFFLCCPGVQALTDSGCFVVTPVHMLAVEVANIQTGVWERRLWSCVLRRLRTTSQSLIVLEADQPMTIPTAHGQTWQGRGSCSGLTQLVNSWESLACLQLCSGSPVGRWWKPSSYG